MAFNSLGFLAFFAAVCAALALTNIPAAKRALGDKLFGARHVLLIAANYVFYASWNWKCCFLLLALTVIAYVSAANCRRSRFALHAGVVLPLVILGVFKYFNFFVGSFCELFGLAEPGALKLLLPVGISFYTFQTLSYIIDVHRGKVEAERSPIKLALYISFFPQLVSGPIVKAGEFLPQLCEDRNVSLVNLEKGVQIFLFGLFKKVVIADNIAVFVNAVYSNPVQFGGGTVLLAVVGYSIQLYCDFSGYSDMAVGCARGLGYELPRNFNMPYLSRSVKEFWKRWHISLSTWLMEYLYIPLGGNRKGKVRNYVNLMLTMVIGGLWHGAAWTFVVWGALHGLALCAHRLWSAWRAKSGTVGESRVYTALSILLTFCFVSFCWVFFRADSFGTAMQILTAVFTWQRGMTHISSWTLFGVIVTAAAMAIACIRSRKLGQSRRGTIRLSVSAAYGGWRCSSPPSGSRSCLPTRARLRLSTHSSEFETALQNAAPSFIYDWNKAAVLVICLYG